MLKFMLLFSLLFGGILSAQSSLDNASFEGEPQDATVPIGWFACAKGTTPDILPGFWGVYNEASEGDTYIGLITRPDGSYESIGQRFQKALEKSECYTFNIDLAHSKTYSGYNQPLKIRIWGGRNKCEQSQLLLETDFIDHSDWKTYEATFTPKVDLNYIILEAFFKEDNFSRKGNILIDNITPIETCIRA